MMIENRTMTAATRHKDNVVEPSAATSKVEEQVSSIRNTGCDGSGSNFLINNIVYDR